MASSVKTARPPTANVRHPLMVDRRRVRNVVYSDYTSATIDYHVDLNAFAVARADIYSSLHPHRLSLILVGTEADLGADRSTIDETIARARPLLERLIEENRALADHLSASEVWVFNVAGQRIR
jgi:hypothetical protein